MNTNKITAILLDGTRITASKIVTPVLKLYAKKVIAGYVIKREEFTLYV